MPSFSGMGSGSAWATAHSSALWKLGLSNTCQSLEAIRWVKPETVGQMPAVWIAQTMNMQAGLVQPLLLLLPLRAARGCLQILRVGSLGLLSIISSKPLLISSPLESMPAGSSAARRADGAAHWRALEAPWHAAVWVQGQPAARGHGPDGRPSAGPWRARLRLCCQEQGVQTGGLEAACAAVLT